MRFVGWLVAVAIVFGLLFTAISSIPPGQTLALTEVTADEARAEPYVTAVDSLAVPVIVARATEIEPLSSLIVSHRDSIIVEAYFNGMAGSRQANVKSVSKSILSALVGIALREGYIQSLDQTAAELLPSYFSDVDDPLKLEITVRHLLMMTAGLESTSSRNYGRWVSSRDWTRFAIDQPIVSSPGSGIIYSTGSSHILSAILTESTGMSTLDFATQYLFEPLDMERPAWERSPEGYYLGGNNMSFRPKDLVNFGRMYLNRGLHNGTRILSEEWIDDSIGRYNQSLYNVNEQGYHWWSRDLNDMPVHFGFGYGGQFLFVVPDLELVVICTSRIEGNQRIPGHNGRIYDLLEHEIMPAIRRIPVETVVSEQVP